MASTSQKASEEALPAFDAEAPAPTPAPAVEVNPEAGVASECDSHEAAPKAATVDGSSSSPLTAAQEPALTPQEFRVYNRLSELMNYYHEHFRRTWTLLYNACSSGRRPANMSLKQFIDEGLQFVQHLTAHHNIEETYMFPMLARKMPEFESGCGKGGNKQAAELLRQHRLIHAGMDEFEEYLRRCRGREIELELGVLKTKMDSWGGVLWTHLDQEVRTLGAENMRRYWSLDEMKNLPI